MRECERRIAYGSGVQKTYPPVDAVRTEHTDTGSNDVPGLRSRIGVRLTRGVNRRKGISHFCSREEDDEATPWFTYDHVS
jgi:hypothetical protein